MKLIDLLNVIECDTNVVLCYLNAQNIGYQYICADVPSIWHDFEVCEITADGNDLIIVVVGGADV